MKRIFYIITICLICLVCASCVSELNVYNANELNVFDANESNLSDSNKLNVSEAGELNASTVSKSNSSEQSYLNNGEQVAQFPLVRPSNSKVVTSPEQYQDEKFPVVAAIPQRDIYLYSNHEIDGVALYVNGKCHLFDWNVLNPGFVLPRMNVADYDNDGLDELAIIVHIGSGTGASLDELHILELGNETDLKDFVFDNYLNNAKQYLNLKGNINNKNPLIGSIVRFEFSGDKILINLGVGEEIDNTPPGNFVGELNAEVTNKLGVYEINNLRYTSYADMAIDTYKNYYAENYANKKVNVFLRDLTHDGIKEMITVELLNNEGETLTSNDDIGQLMVSVFTSNGKSITKIYELSTGKSHAGWNWLYLYKEDGKDYLLQYNPTMYQGVGTYQYDIFYLDNSGQQVTLKKEDFNFILQDSTLDKSKEKEYKLWQRNADSYRRMSLPLVEIGNEYFTNKSYLNYTKANELY